MKRGWPQTLVLLSVAIVGMVAVVAGRTESEPRLIAEYRRLEVPQPDKTALSRVPLESLIREAIDGPAGNASDAAAQLVVAGIADPKIVALLLKRFEVTKGRPSAIAILARIGSRVTPQALLLLNDELAEVRWSVLRLLLCLENLPPSIAPQIARCLNDEDVWVRRWAAMLLAQIDNEACLAELMTACRDNDAEVRWRALRALHRGRSLSDLPESLRQDALADTDPDVRYVASHLPESTVVDRQP